MITFEGIHPVGGIINKFGLLLQNWIRNPKSIFYHFPFSKNWKQKYPVSNILTTLSMNSL